MDAPTPPPAQPAAPVPGGTALVKAVEDAPLLVVGILREPAAKDVHGWGAKLVVEQVLHGTATPGAVLEIGWEELARGRAPRFQAEGRALLALEPLPASSLWHQRFPTPGALAVAAAGDAFLRDPDAATLDLLARWANLAASEREGAAGVAALAALSAGASPRVAEGAVARLAEIPGLEGKLAAESTAALSATLGDASRPVAVRQGLLRLAGTRGLHALEPAIEPLAHPGSPLEAQALDALGTMNGGLPAARVKTLLRRPEASVRAAAVRQARGAEVDAVARLVTADASPEVRAAAVAALLEARGMAGFDIAKEGLFDRDRNVRAAAAEHIGALGSAAIPGLVALVNARGMPAATGPIGALILTGDEGRAAVKAIAETHPDPDVRKVARLALGHLGAAH